MGNLTWRPPGAGFPRGVVGLLRGNNTGTNCFPLTSRSIHPKLSLSKCSARWDIQEKDSLETLFPPAHPDSVRARRSSSPTSAPRHSPAPNSSQQLVSPTEGPLVRAARPGLPAAPPKCAWAENPVSAPAQRSRPPTAGDQFALCPGARARGPCPRAPASGFPRPRVGGAGFPSRRPRLPPAVTTHLLFRG